MNRKRIERLWRAEGHRVPPRRSHSSGQRAQGTALNAAWNLPAGCPDHVWSYDFTSGRTRRGGSLRILNVVDEYTRLALACRVDRSIGARDVRVELEELFRRHGKPRILRSDNGREFIAATLQAWLAEQGVETAFIEEGSPQQNPYVERFNGSMRDELLNGEEFDSLWVPRSPFGFRPSSIPALLGYPVHPASQSCQRLPSLFHARANTRLLRAWQGGWARPRGV